MCDAWSSGTPVRGMASVHVWSRQGGQDGREFGLRALEGQQEVKQKPEVRAGVKGTTAGVSDSKGVIHFVQN